MDHVGHWENQRTDARNTWNGIFGLQVYSTQDVMRGAFRLLLFTRSTCRARMALIWASGCIDVTHSRGHSATESSVFGCRIRLWFGWSVNKSNETHIFHWFSFEIVANARISFSFLFLNKLPATSKSNRAMKRFECRTKYSPCEVFVFFFLFRIDVEGALALRRTRASIFTQKQCNENSLKVWGGRVHFAWMKVRWSVPRKSRDDTGESRVSACASAEQQYQK